MTSDIRLPPILPGPSVTGPAAKPADPGAMVLQLLRPIDALLLPAGQTRPAEVVSSNAKGSQFDLVLRLMQTADAPAREIPATSPRPLTNGTQLVIQAVSQTQLMAILQPTASTAAREPLVKLDPAQFPVGTRVQLEVVSQQQLQLRSEQARFAVLAKLLQGPAAGSLLNLSSSKAVPPGTLISAQVGPQGELRVPDPGRQQLALTLMQGLRETLQRQAPAEPLLAGLERLSQQPQMRGTSLPPSLDNAVRQVLQQVANLPQLTSARGVEQAILRSGSFLEPNLLKLSNMLKAETTVAPNQSTANQSTLAEGRADRNAVSPAASLPALSKLIAALSAQPVGVDSPALPGADLKASLINLLLQLQQQLPGATLKAMGLAPGPWQQGHAIVPSGAFPLPARAMQALTEAPDLGALLRLTAALLSRIQHHQLQSVGQSQTFSDGTTQTTWQLEIPLRDGQQFSHVQVRIQRDDDAQSKNSKQEQTPHWEVRLAFNLDQLGALQAIARLYKGRVSTEFWAEQAHTLVLLDSELTQLRDRLLAKGLEVGELSCHRGTPPQPNRPVQQSWIDEVT